MTIARHPGSLKFQLGSNPDTVIQVRHLRHFRRFFRIPGPAPSLSRSSPLRCAVVSYETILYNTLYIDVDVRLVLRIGGAGSKRRSKQGSGSSAHGIKSNVESATERIA